MSDNQDGAAELGVQAVEQLEHALRGARIEIAGRLVCQQQRWTGHQRTGNGDPLLLATRDLRGFLVGERAEADLLEQGARQVGLRPGGFAVADHQRHQHVLQHAERRDQVMELKHEADRLIAQLSARFVVAVACRLAEYIQLAGAGRIQQADQVQQSALAGAGRADQRGQLAAPKLQVDAVQHFGLQGCADVEGLAHLFQAQDFLGRGHWCAFTHSGSPPPGRNAPHVARASPPPARR